MLARLFLLASAMLLGVVSLFAQEGNTFVKITGEIINQKDSTAVNAVLQYEKLPYYDDIGRISTGSSGSFESYLIKDLKYNISITKDGFEPFSQQITIEDGDGDGMMESNFFLVPLEVEEEEIFTLENLIFNSGSSVIQQASYVGLDDFADWLDDRPSYVVQLEGHTDIAGNPDANMRLSLARVEAVKDYITKKGIKKNRILTKAFGGTRPLSTERTPEAKRANRRVEVRVIGR